MTEEAMEIRPSRRLSMLMYSSIVNSTAMPDRVSIASELLTNTVCTMEDFSWTLQQGQINSECSVLTVRSSDGTSI